MNRTALTRLVTVLTILALLVMVLPMSVMAKGNGGKTPPGQVQKNEKPETAPKAEPKKSVEAQFVAARNTWAKDNDLPPGHVNILFRYLVADAKIDPAAFSEDPANITAAIAEIELYFGSIKDNPEFFADGRLSIPTIMGALKQLKLVSGETADEPDEEEEEPDEEDELPDPDDAAPTPPAVIPTPPAA